MVACKLALLRGVAQSVVETGRRTRSVHVVEPFEAFLDLESEASWNSLAVPVHGAAVPVRPAIQELRLLFGTHGRALRLEFLQELYPWLAAELEDCGMESAGRQPLMLCDPADLKGPHAAPISVLPVEAAGDQQNLRRFLAVQAAAYGEPAPIPDREVACLRRDLASGRMCCVLGLLDGEVAGVAALVGIGEVRELAGVGTLPSVRRRGVAAALSFSLAREHFRSGGKQVWLTAGDDAAERVYRGLGFGGVGAWQLDYGDGAPPT